MKINKNSLQAKIMNLSKNKGISPNVILQNYFFEAFLKRLSKSKYSDNFVFKGGFLLSSTLGIDFRATLDIDFLLRNFVLTRESIIKIFEDVTKLSADDNVKFDFFSIEEIRKDDDYGGFKVSILGQLENVKVIVNIDIATGDPITPNAVIYEYKCLFDKEIISFQAYNFETIIAEKLQTVLSRGTTNSRCKDFYDLYIIHKLRWENIDIIILKKAFTNTCEYRNTLFSKEQAISIINNIASSNIMISRWKLFKKKNVFVGNLEFSDTIASIKQVIEYIYKKASIIT